ncbi:MAG: glycosyltransferase family 2 protein, partial [Bacteroidaceae bacterium]|nr:glycosyltransferase family 2 protein [Bacteroidaceae bacterium]
MSLKYSFIIPVYNRPDEVAELLESLTLQRLQDFEVVIVEDGSSIPCKAVCDSFAEKLTIRYFAKENGGPGPARNYGAERAEGQWLIILDSDVVLPPDYLSAVEQELKSNPCDAFGG